MRIFFHIGPHKTGTTSLQDFLLKTIGSVEPKSIWYPLPERIGPGHADLAEKMLPHKRKPSDNAIKDIVQKAEINGVEKLILSSENFSTITESIADYQVAMQDHEITLVSTQNSLVLRAASRWQEWIKGRFTQSFEQSHQRILESPGYQIDLLHRFADGLKVKDIAVIYCSPTDASSRLIERAASLFEVSCQDYLIDIKDTKLNTRLGLMEAELLRRLNELLAENFPKTTAAEYAKVRGALLAAFRSPNWRDVKPYVEIKNTNALTEAILMRAHEIEKSIETLRWPLREYGDRTALFAVGKEPIE